MHVAMGIGCLVLVAGCAGPSLEVRSEPGAVHIACRGEPFATVRTDAEPRPHVWPLYAPGGIAVTRAFPMGVGEGEQHDHAHHQSLWFAHGDVDGFDFWHGSDRGERIVLTESHVCADRDRGVVVHCAYRWVVDPDRTLLTERRAYRFADHGAYRTVDVCVCLRPAAAAVTFGDTKEGAFALRVHPALRVVGQRATGALRNSEGAEGKEVWGQRARWIDDTGTIAGKRVGIAVFDHPGNLRHPTHWHARTYGLLAANPFGLHDFEGKPRGTGDFVLKHGQSLDLRYRIVLHPGFAPERLEAAYREWCR